MNHQPLIELRDVSKVYPLKAGDVVALDRMSLSIDAGEFLAIMGPSGSGKSTLLNQLGCLDRPTSGDLLIEIFQKFNLVPLLTAYENVEFPWLMKHRRPDDTGRVESLLSQMGIDTAMATHRPAELSGGQQQRVAIARALVNDPRILLCDEPTGNIDSVTGRQIMEMIKGLNEQGRTVLMVTHDPTVAAYAKRQIVIRDGRLA